MPGAGFCALAHCVPDKRCAHKKRRHNPSPFSLANHKPKNNMATNTTTWGSRIGFILAGAGSAIGLGSIWKFPFWAGINGGSGFIIPYIVFTFTIGITLLIAELVVGRAGRGSAMHALKSLGGPFFAVFGAIAVITSFVILSYYSVVGGWCVKYLFDSLCGELVTSDAQALQSAFGSLVADGAANSMWHIGFLTLTCGVVALGVVNGIERLSKYLLPTLFILMIAIMIRSLSLPGAWEGVKFLFDFSFDKLSWMGVLNAMGFTFFSLSLGCGIMVTYGAYLKDTTDIPNSSLWIAYLAIQTALLAGLMIMPAVFAMGQDPNAGPGLVFVTIPYIFSQIPFGWFFMILFNVCLLVAALTSSVSLLEVCIAYLQNEWHMGRGAACGLCYAGLAALGCVSALSFGVLGDVKIFGRIIFDFLDWFCSNIMMPVGGLSIALLAGWKAWESTQAQVNLVHRYSAAANSFIRFSLRFLAPLLVLVVIATGI